MTIGKMNCSNSRRRKNDCFRYKNPFERIRAIKTILNERIDRLRTHTNEADVNNRRTMFSKPRREFYFS